MIRLTDSIAVPDHSIVIHFVLASGPGGQNVNKVATAAQLRFHLDSAGLRPEVRSRLERLAGNRLTRQGEVIIDARRFRSQERNRADALARLSELVDQAQKVPRPRIPTRMSKAAKVRRTVTKQKRSNTKNLRGRPGHDD